MLSIAIISCSDSDKSVNQKFDRQPYSFGGSYTNLWNPSNPFDSIGFIHNNILDYAISQYGGPFGAPNFSSNLSTIISSHCYSVYSHTISKDTLDVSTENYYDDLYEAMGDSLTFSEYLEETFSPNIRTSLLQIFNIMGDYFTENLVGAAIEQIKIVETTVSENGTYSQHEKNVILATSAGAKFSLVYWADATYNNDSEWSDWGEDYDPEFEQPGYIEWVAAAIADAIKIGIEIDKGNQDPVDIAAKAGVSSAFAYLACTATVVENIIGAVIGFFGSLF